jgi:hypothetical protein
MEDIDSRTAAFVFYPLPEGDRKRAYFGIIAVLTGLSRTDFLAVLVFLL